MSKKTTLIGSKKVTWKASGIVSPCITGAVQIYVEHMGQKYAHDEVELIMDGPEANIDRVELEMKVYGTPTTETRHGNVEIESEGKKMPGKSNGA